MLPAAEIRSGLGAVAIGGPCGEKDLVPAGDAVALNTQKYDIKLEIRSPGRSGCCTTDLQSHNFLTLSLVSSSNLTSPVSK